MEQTLSKTLPAPLRTVLRDLCWITADEYLHHDTHVKEGTAFVPGSFGGNPELLPLLRLSILCDPSFIDAWLLLAENQAFYFDRFEDGVDSLAKAIRLNPDNPRRHELWAQLAYLHQYIPRYSPRRKSNPQAALTAIESALAAARDLPHAAAQRPDFSVEAYQALQARLLVDLGRPREALLSWKAAGQPLDDSSVLSRYLRLVEAGASLPANPRDLGELPAKHVGDSTPRNDRVTTDKQPGHHEPACPQCSHDAGTSTTTRILVQSFFLSFMAVLLFTFSTPRIKARKDHTP